MSDTSAWPPGSPAEAVMAELAAYRDRLRALAAEYPEDGSRREAYRDAELLWEDTTWRVQRRLEAPMRIRASAPVPAPVEQRREPGVNTSYKIRHFAPNQGRLGDR